MINLLLAGIELSAWGWEILWVVTFGHLSLLLARMNNS